MPNLKNNKKYSHIKAVFQDKYLVFFLAIILVVAINQIVFSYLLLDRERARAFSSVYGALFYTDFGDQNIAAGTTGVVLAEFFVPDAWGDDSLTCDYTLAGNPCVTFVDGDGSASGGAGTADDGAISVFDFEPNGQFANSFFQASDGVCTDSLTAPTCVYTDSGGDCDSTDGDVHTYLLGAACGTGADTLVPTAVTLSRAWMHTELISANGAYDDGEDIYILGHTEDLVLATGSDWTNAIAGQWQGDSFAVPVGNETFIDLDTTTVGGFDGIATEPAIIDLDGDGLYGDTADTLLDADGTGTTGIGTDDDAIADGTALAFLVASDGICLNTGGQGGVGSVIIYQDGNGNCIVGDGGADVVIRDDPGSGLSGGPPGIFPYTFIPLIGAAFYNDADFSGTWTFGASAAATESLWVELQGLNAWHVNIEGAGTGAIEADGTGTIGKGVDDDPVSRGASLSYLLTTDFVCIGIAVPGFGFEDIYVDGSGIPGECIPGNGGTDIILLDTTADGLLPGSTFDGTWASGAGTLVYIDYLAPFGAYTFGAGVTATESLWIENVRKAIYTSAADTDVYTTGLAIAGDTLSGAPITGPNGVLVQYIDADGSGTLTANDTMVEDIGNVQTGPGGVPNGVLDRQAEMIDTFTFENLGTSLFTDLINIQFRVDRWWFFGDGRCDATDASTGTFTQLDATNFTISTTPSSYGTFFRGCIIADISTAAVPFRTIQLGVPQLSDAGTPGLYDIGDLGWFFYSNNDGPTGAAMTVPYTYTIGILPSYGAGGEGALADTTPPNNVSNIIVTADFNGQVVTSWQDPPDPDLAQIVITETSLGTTMDSIAPGIETLVLNNRVVGQTYTYIFKTIDSNGNESAEKTVTITIPEVGLVSESFSEILEEFPVPSPEAVLPDGIEVGDLLKKDQPSATVYFIGNDMQRHVFPNESTFFTWFENFDNIKVVSRDILSQIQLNSNVTVRSGTKLVKITTDPKVYVVEPGAVIRPIKSTAIAVALYGENWTSRIIDVADVFFVDYTVGSEINQAIHPTGSLIQYKGSTNNYYIDQGTKRLVTLEVFAADLFRDEFVIRGVLTSTSYSDGPDFPEMKIDIMMTLR